MGPGVSILGKPPARDVLKGRTDAWTDTQTEYLIARVNKGISYRKIAKEIADKFRRATGSSISSQVSKLRKHPRWRDKLAPEVCLRDPAATRSKQDPAKTPKPPSQRPAPSAISAAARREDEALRDPVFRGPPPRTDTSKPARWNFLPPLGPPIRTMTLPRTGRCRWPVADDALPPTPGGYSCGAATDGHRYCPHHRMISLRKNRREA